MVSMVDRIMPPKMSIFYSPEPLNILYYVAKGLHRFKDFEIRGFILGYPNGYSLITRTFIKWNSEGQSERDKG